jgi:outer membrane protein OmpA-like peptidoglycan-associated protein
MSRAFRLGVFIFSTLVILAVGVFLIGDKRFLFRHTYRLSASFQNVAGLDNGADVQVGGIHVGTVKYVSLPGGANGNMTVVMDLSDSTKNLIHKDSVAAIKTEGLLGDKYLEVSMGSEKAPPIENGDTIKGANPVDFSDAALSAANQAKSTAAAFQDDAEALKSNFLLKGFFKGRGYQDASDLTKNRIAQLPAKQSAKDFAYNVKDIFDKTNAKLKDKKKLNEAGQFLAQNKFDLAVVADSEELGDSSKDRVLSEARANVVRDYLIQNFKLDDTRLKIIGLGKSDKSGDTGKVEILVYGLEAPKTSAENR